MSRAPCVPLALAALLLLAPPAEAQGSGLAHLHGALSTYDLDGTSTTQAIAQLGPIAARGGADATEARYLRALSATDLHIALALGAPEALAVRLSDALGVPAAEVRSHLRSELGAVRTGVYRQAVDEALDQLSILDAIDAGTPVRWTARRGPRRDALFVYALSHAAADARAAFVDDPCAARCDAPLDGWDVPSRRAITALRTAAQGMARVRRAATDGDPLLAALRARLDAMLSALLASEIAPSATLPEGVTIVGSEGGAPMSPDVLVVVTTSAVHLGFAPRVRVGEDGALAVRAAGEPALPSLRATALPASLPTVPVAIDELTAAMAPIAALGSGARIALAIAPDVEAHVVVRTMLSMLRANAPPTALVARGADGSLRGVTVRVARTADAGTSDVRVRVRLGGYSVARGPRGREQSVPRIRVEGEWAFDREALRTQLASRPYASAQLDAMGAVPAAELVHAAMLVGTGLVGTGEAQLTLVI